MTKQSILNSAIAVFLVWCAVYCKTGTQRKYIHIDLLKGENDNPLSANN